MPKASTGAICCSAMNTSTAIQSALAVPDIKPGGRRWARACSTNAEAENDEKQIRDSRYRHRWYECESNYRQSQRTNQDSFRSFNDGPPNGGGRAQGNFRLELFRCVD